MLNRVKTYLEKPIDISILVAYRILFGLCMMLHAFVYNAPEVILQKYVLPDFFFSFGLFDWLNLPILSDMGFYYLFTFMGLAAFCVMVGWFYYVSLSVLLVTQIYIVLLEKAYMPDPNYLYILITFLMFFVRANRCFAIDMIFFPKKQLSAVPQFYLWILRLQFFIVYFYSGLAKITHGDWLHARQMSLWLARLKDVPFVGHLFIKDFTAYFFSYGGMLFDLSIGFFLLFKKTRIPAIMCVFFFHFFNKYLLYLNLVPWFVLAATVLFLEPETPRRWGRFFVKHLLSFVRFKELPTNSQNTISPTIFWFFIVYFIVQIFFPLRPYLLSDYPSWTRAGVRFSWRLMTDSFLSQMKIFHTPLEQKGCFTRQPFTAEQAWWMSGNPEIILQYVKFFEQELKQCGISDPQVFVDSQVSLNGRALAPLIDSSADLTQETYNPWKKPRWVNPHPDKQNKQNIKDILHPDLDVYEVNFQNIAIDFDI